MQAKVPTGGYIYSIVRLQTNPVVIAIKSNVIQKGQAPAYVIERMLQAADRANAEAEVKLFRWVYVPSNILERRDLATSIVDHIVSQQLGKRLSGKQIQIKLNPGIPISLVGTIFDDLTAQYFNFNTVSVTADKHYDQYQPGEEAEASDMAQSSEEDSREEDEDLEDFVVPDEIEVEDLSGSYDEDAEEDESYD